MLVSSSKSGDFAQRAFYEDFNKFYKPYGHQLKIKMKAYKKFTHIKETRKIID